MNFLPSLVILCKKCQFDDLRSSCENPRNVTRAVRQSLLNFLQSARRHRIVVSVLMLIGAALLLGGTLEIRTLEMITYLSAVVLCAAIVDVSVAFLEKPRVAFPVRVPRTEITVAAVLYFASAGVFAFRFSGLFPPHSPWSKILYPAAMLLLGFHIFLALFLLLRGYWTPRPRDAILGIRSRAFNHGWLHEFGSAGNASEKCLGGKLPQYWRLYLGLGSGRPAYGCATRRVLSHGLADADGQIAEQLGSRVAGGIVAVGVTAFIHVCPRAVAFTGTFWILYIVPYGLLLGYITHRTRSILPAIVLHATKFVWLGNLG